MAQNEGRPISALLHVLRKHRRDESDVHAGLSSECVNRLGALSHLEPIEGFRGELIQWKRELATVDKSHSDEEFVAKLDSLKRKLAGGDMLRLLEEADRFMLATGKPREHHIHQYQVFLLGCIILDRFHEKVAFERNADKPKLSGTWLVASMFHDCAFVAEKWPFLAKQMKRRLRLDVFAPEKGPVSSEDLKVLKRIADHAISRGMVSPGKTKLFRANLIRCLKARNHAVLGGLAVLNMSDAISASGRSFDSLEAATAVALHSKEVYAPRPGTKKKEKGRRGRRPLLDLRLEQHPVPFALIACDAMQEWGRPSLDPKYSSIPPDNPFFHFSKMDYGCCEIHARLDYREHAVAGRDEHKVATDLTERLKAKRSELRLAQKVLRSDTCTLNVTAAKVGEDGKALELGKKSH